MAGLEAPGGEDTSYGPGGGPAPIGDDRGGGKVPSNPPRQAGVREDGHGAVGEGVPENVGGGEGGPGTELSGRCY